MENFIKEKKFLPPKKFLNYNKLFLVTVCFVLVFFNQARAASAASLYLSPSAGSYEINKTFSVNVFVSSSNQAINAVSGNIVFSADKLEVVSLTKINSAVNLWVQEPSFSNVSGTIKFEGIILNPGFIGSAGKILTATFKATDAGEAALKFSSASVLANDGLGTNIINEIGVASYGIIAKIEKEKAVEIAIPAEQETVAPEAAADKEEKINELSGPEIISLSHPDQDAWYANNRAEFKWNLPSGTTGVSVLLNEKPVSNPGPISDGLFPNKEYVNLEDGIWYFHLKIKSGQNWSEIAHYKIQIDTVPPEPYKIEISESDFWPVLNFKTIDSLSGMDGYKIKIGNDEIRLDGEQNNYKIESLPPGDYTIIIKAFDRAGNEEASAADFTVKAIEAPIIKDYSPVVTTVNNFFINGIAVKDTIVNLYIQRQDESKAILTRIKTNMDGRWYAVGREILEKGSYVSLINEIDFQKSYSVFNISQAGEGSELWPIKENFLADGQYIVWAQATNDQGLQSGYSEKINFFVSPPIFAQIGSFVVNYFTVFVSLIFMLVLISVLLIYIVEIVRKKIKKETVEIKVVLRKNLEELFKSVSVELDGQKKLSENSVEFNSQRLKVKARVKNKIEAAGRKILKEINDVEKMLK